MTIRHYPVLICDDGVCENLGVVFPDLPGCVTVGTDVQHAAEMAAEVLALYVEGMVEEGMALPAPSALGVVPAWIAADFGTVVANVLVSVDVLGKPVRGAVGE